MTNCPPVPNEVFSNDCGCNTTAIPSDAFTLSAPNCGCPDPNNTPDLTDFVKRSGPPQNVLGILNFSLSPTAPDATEDDQVVTLGQLDEAIIANISSEVLVSPVITSAWTIFQSDGTTPYSILPTSSAKNIIVDIGAIANLSSTYQYPAASTGQADPTSVSGDYGTTLPAPATPSSPALVVNGIVANTTKQVTLIRPATGLVANLTTGQVTAATGNNTTGDSSSVAFEYRSYFGYSTSASLSPSDILSMTNKAFATSRSRSFSGVTAGVGYYTYYIYDNILGALVNIIQNGSLPVLGAFTLIATVVVTNDAGVSRSMYVYRTNATNAFTNVTLAFS